MTNLYTLSPTGAVINGIDKATFLTGLFGHFESQDNDSVIKMDVFFMFKDIVIVILVLNSNSIVQTC